MEIKLYDLKTQGTQFKADFNDLERIKKVYEERKDEYYFKIDIVRIKNKLYLIKRYANFKTNEARMQTELIDN